MTYMSPEEPGQLEGRLDGLTGPDRDNRLGSSRLVVCRRHGADFDLHRASRVRVVLVRGSVERVSTGTHIRVVTSTTWSTAWRAIVIFSVVFGLLLMMSSLFSRPSIKDILLDLVVPFVSGIFTILVIFFPAAWWMIARHGTAQAKWLLGYAEGLISGPANGATTRVVA